MYAERRTTMSSVKTMWIPRSERGRKVVRTLKSRGYAATYKNTIGRYVFSLPFASELTSEDLRLIVYDIGPELAAHMDDTVEYYTRLDIKDGGNPEQAQKLWTEKVFS